MKIDDSGSICLLLLLAFAALAPAAAQTASAPHAALTLRTRTDSISARGRRDGAALASGRSAGACLRGSREGSREGSRPGFFLAPAAARNAVALLGVGARVTGTVAAVAAGGTRLPSGLEARLATRDSVYREAFRRGYRERLRSRRVRAAGAGAIGAVTGVVTLYALILTLVDT